MGRDPLVAQKPSGVTMVCQLALLGWGVAQQMHDAAAPPLGASDLVFVMAVSYLYCDYWLWLLHCFLDRKENTTSSIGYIKEMAVAFQGHHDFPSKLLTANHLEEIDLLITGTAATGLLLGAWTSPVTKFIVVMVGFWGMLAGANHYYGHAATNRYDIPALYKHGQRFGLLPTAKHHKIHHTAPFEENWVRTPHHFIIRPRDVVADLKRSGDACSY
jgi:hypothetical protein